MAGLAIIYNNMNIYTICENLEHAYFLGAMLCVKPYSYLSCINAFSLKHSFTISPSYSDITVTIYFGSIMPNDAQVISMNELLKIQNLCERIIVINEFKKKNEGKKNLIPSYMLEDYQLK